jgi:hypothetical protein
MWVIAAMISAVKTSALPTLSTVRVQGMKASYVNESTFIKYSKMK